MKNKSEFGRMKFSVTSFAFLFLFLLPCLSSWGQADMRNGAVFIVAKEGLPIFLGADNKPLPASEVEKDDTLPQGATVKTGAKGKVVLLFSNGTVTTVEANSILKLKEFLQEGFDAKGRKMSDLLKEPSTSNLQLHLETGSLVVGTKSLQKDSRMGITTPTGTAGIRGTQFQLNQKPTGALALDVTESTVAFTPKGAAAPTMVNANRGLDVAIGGVLAPRPINPIVAQRVNNTNAGAFAMSEDIQLSEVSAKMEETTTPDSEPDGDSKDGDSKDGDSGDGDSGDGDSGDGDGSSDSGDGDSGSSDSGDGDSGSSDSGDGDSGSSDSGGSQSTGSEATAGPESQPATETTSAGITAEAPGGASVDQSQVVENNPETKLIRKLGVLDERTDRMLDKAFSEEQMRRFLTYPVDLQELLLNETPEVVQRLMNIQPAADSLYVFYGYDPALNRRLLEINDDLALGNLFQERYDEEFANALITADNLNLLNQSQNEQPGTLNEPSDANLFDLATTLLQNTTANGNQFILTDLIERGGGALTYELILAGLEGDSLLTDVAFEGNFIEDRLFLGEQVMSNSYYQDVSSTLEEATSFLGYSSGFKFLAYSGRNVSLYGGAYDFSPAWAEDAQTAVLSASDNLDLQGNITFSSWTPQPTLVLMSGNEFTIQPETTVSYPGGNLTLLSGGDLSVNNAILIAGEELSLKSLQNLSLTNSTIEAKQARLEAASKLSLNTVGFGSNLSTLYLQATTVNLSNVNFPSGSMINLNSLKGAIDSKYPNFGNEARGRVNFINEVKYGGSLMNDRPSFDLHGNNVTIGKIPGQ